MQKFSRESGVRQAGLSVVEMVVALGIITAISAMVLVNFSGYNQHIAINRASRELIVAIRRAQHIALSVVQIGGESPKYSGIQLIVGTGQKYPVFSDKNESGSFDGGDITIEEPSFEHGVFISDFKDTSGASLGVNTAHVLFRPPEARISITDATGSSLGDFMEIELRSPSGLIKKIVVRTSGQISAK